MVYSTRLSKSFNCNLFGVYFLFYSAWITYWKKCFEDSAKCSQYYSYFFGDLKIHRQEKNVISNPIWFAFIWHKGKENLYANTPMKWHETHKLYGYFWKITFGICCFNTLNVKINIWKYLTLLLIQRRCLKRHETNSHIHNI